MDKYTQAREHLENLERLILPEDRQKLYLEVAQEVLREYKDGYKIPFETQRQIAEILAGRKHVDLGSMAKGADMDLRLKNNGAKIHRIPSLQTALRFYYKEIKEGELPSHPLVLALEHPIPFGILFSSLCNARKDFGISF